MTNYCLFSIPHRATITKQVSSTLQLTTREISSPSFTDLPSFTTPIVRYQSRYRSQYHHLGCRLTQLRQHQHLIPLTSLHSTRIIKLRVIKVSRSLKGDKYSARRSVANRYLSFYLSFLKILFFLLITSIKTPAGTDRLYGFSFSRSPYQKS